VKKFDFPQYSEGWWTTRKGVPTASNFGKIFTAKTMKPSASQDDYIAELIADKVDRTPPDFVVAYTNPEMIHGLETEGEARDFYSMDRNLDVEQVGFCLTDDERFGCSPDGLVGADGGLELKCPQLKTQVKYLLDGGLPDEYRAQVHGSLIVTGRKWWDFLSYAPGLPPLLLRVTPDDYTKALAAALDPFWAKYQAAWERIQKTVKH
jgi:hypothetical protein